MLDIENLTSRIKRNCNISDARYWGAYSLCGFLLRLRELYRIERGIKPWERIPQKEIAEWISEREKLWKELEDRDFIDITVDGNVYAPFDVEKLNTALEKEGLIYSAGYGEYMKPSFFLADLVSKKIVDGHNVYIAGNEYVRDLSAYPAMLQDSVIFARVDTTKQLLWGKFEELRHRRIKGFLAFAFSRYDITPEEQPSEDIDRRLSLIATSEVETYIHHEIGEAIEGKKLGDEWKNMLRDLSCSKAEHFARGIKDLLSDTSEKGMMRYIIDKRKEASLGFYIAFLVGYRRLLFPEILNAARNFVETGDWGLIEDARKAGYKKAESYAERLLSIGNDKGDRARVSEYIEKELLGGIKYF